LDLQVSEEHHPVGDLATATATAAVSVPIEFFGHDSSEDEDTLPPAGSYQSLFMRSQRSNSAVAVAAVAAAPFVTADVAEVDPPTGTGAVRSTRSSHRPASARRQRPPSRPLGGKGRPASARRASRIDSWARSACERTSDETYTVAGEVEISGPRRAQATQVGHVGLSVPISCRRSSSPSARPPCPTRHRGHAYDSAWQPPAPGNRLVEVIGNTMGIGTAGATDVVSASSAAGAAGDVAMGAGAEVASPLPHRAPVDEGARVAEAGVRGSVTVAAGMGTPVRSPSVLQALYQGLCSFVASENLLDLCVICLDEIALGQRVVRAPCGHCFHQACIQNWMITSLSCPLCKRSLVRGGRGVTPDFRGWTVAVARTAAGPLTAAC